jgi:hypothetical protein
MKPRSAKHKGRRFQQAVRKVILEQFPQLKDYDVKVVFRSEAGTDIKLSSVARSVFPYSVECKNVERLNIWGALSQAQSNTAAGTTPLLIFGRNRAEPHVAMKLKEFMKLLPPPPPGPPPDP